jgi:hypothetical protein
MSDWSPVPCPKCQNPQVSKVGFTWWGGVLGPKLFKHTRCPNCATTFNGLTGKSNTNAIAIYMVIAAGLGILLAVLLFSGLR